MQLTGPHRDRRSRIAYEAGRPCMACWLVEQWEAQGDARAKREDRYALAAQIAEGKGKRIDLPASVPLKSHTAANPLADVATADLIAELQRRGVDIEH